MVRFRVTTEKTILLAMSLAFGAAACGSDSPVDPDPGGTVASVEVTPAGAWLVGGDTLRLSVTLRDAQGTVVEGVPVTWESGNPSAVTVSSTGLVEVLEPRELAAVQVRARAEGRTGSATLRVWNGGGRRVPVLAAFDSVVMGLMDAHRIPGGVVGVMHDGRLVLARAYGHADASAAPRRMLPDARFRVAEISQPITGAAILKLVEEGRLDLSRAAFEILQDLEPPGGAQEDPRLGQITVRMLLHHAAGWNEDLDGDPLLPPRSNEAAAALGVERPPHAETIVRFMRGQPLHFEPATTFRRSNFGYVVLGRIIERVTGTTYSDFVRTEILAPLGIQGMRIGGTRAQDRLPNEVIYHDGTTVNSVFPGQSGAPAPYGGFYIEAMDASAGWVASVPDLLRFAAGLDGRDTRPDLLAPATRELMLEAPPWPIFSGPTHVGAGGWTVRMEGGDTISMQTGWLPGVTTLLLQSSRGYAIAGLFNAHSTPINAFRDAVEQALRSLSNGVAQWPEHDLFDDL